MVSQPAERSDEVVDMVQYLRDFIAQIDDAVTPWLVKREELAVRLAALDAASDRDVAEAAADYRDRVAGNRPYEHAEDAKALLSEAHRRYCP